MRLDFYAGLGPAAAFQPAPYVALTGLGMLVPTAESHF